MNNSRSAQPLSGSYIWAVEPKGQINFVVISADNNMNSIIKLLTQFNNDDAGIVVSSELVLIATICILPLVVGLSEVSSAINSELSDLAGSFRAPNQVDISGEGSSSSSNDSPECDIAYSR